MNTIERIDDEIGYLIDGLGDLDPGSKEYTDNLNAIKNLMDTEKEIKKLKSSDEDDKKFEKLKFWVTTALTAGGIIIPTLLTIWGTKVSLDFEREGTVTTIMGRGFISRLLGKK